jgi:hypothetical protein
MSRIEDDPLPPAVPGVTGEGIADDSPRLHLGARLATPPVETPGPSVSAPRLPQSETERTEWADLLKPDPEFLPPRDREDALIAQEESAAAAEARRIGGWAPHDAENPAMDPVYEAGGGEQDGWEAAEADLVENASHGDGRGNPERDMLAPEAESDRSNVDYGEADSVRSTELVEGDDHSPRSG